MLVKKVEGMRSSGPLPPGRSPTARRCRLTAVVEQAARAGAAGHASAEMQAYSGPRDKNTPKARGTCMLRLLPRRAASACCSPRAEGNADAGAAPAREAGLCCWSCALEGSRSYREKAVQEAREASPKLRRRSSGPIGLLSLRAARRRNGGPHPLQSGGGNQGRCSSRPSQ